ncbi:MAG: DVUA0089 family protein [Byssovorax sp.]
MSNHHRFRAFLPRRLALSLLWLAVTGAILSMGVGCELIANVDRSQISDTTTTTTTTGQGGAGGQGGSTTTTTGGGGQGGTGGGPECANAGDCPGNDTECQTRTCTDGKCGFDFQASGKVVNDQQPGDCKLNVCDGNGGLTTKDDDADVLDDKNPCTDDTCVMGAPKNPPSTSGTACTDPNNANAKLCDGAGTCVECLAGNDCASGVCEPMDGSCVPPTCMDGVKNGGETDVDCGGMCGTCDDGLVCGVGADCTSKVCTANVCQTATCSDTTENGDETDVDCGGSCAPAQKCGPDKKCSVNADCAGDECSGSICVPNCADGVKNGTESDADCGGATCQKCVPGKVCSVAADCAEGVCDQDVCANPTCNDTVKNGGETDADCGGPCAPAKKCGDGKGCGGPDDCTSGVCTNDVCQAPACNDGVKNGLEGGLDCGAVCPMLCADGSSCIGAGDCQSGVCSGNVCQVAGCNDGVQNGTETGVDCGGSCAPAKTCADGLGCSGGGDCQSGVCSGNVCQIPTCNDSTKNGAETDVDCGGSCATKCADGKACGVGGDCQSGVCTGNVCAAPACGDGVKNGAEGCDDGGQASGDGCSATCTVEAGYACNSASPNVCAPVCGDNLIVGGETCDDGNQVSGDCCSSSCQIEAGCEVEPNNTAPTANTITLAAGVGQIKGGIKPLADTDYFKFTLGATSDVTIQTYDGTGADTCAGAGDHDTVITLYGPDGTTQLANNDEGGAGITPCSKIDPSGQAGARQLPAGDYFVKVIRYNNSQIISVYRLKVTVNTTCGDGTKAGFEGCDDGNLSSNDGCSATCVKEAGYTCAGGTPDVCTLTCGNGVIDPIENCDQGGGNHASGDGCSNACLVEAGYTCAGTPSVCTPNCGNGVIDAGEQCDQGGGNMANGDGCSSTCQREANFQCTGTPSVCFPFETSCGDGVDNDGDGQIDLADDDCVVTINFPPCAAGQTRKVFRSSDTPLAIPDNNPTGVTSVINVAGAGAAARSSIVYAITHTFDGDVDMFLTPPGGGAIDVCTDNGGTGDNFVGTVLDNTCTTNVTAGAAPFTGCFKPENPITTTADGAWSLKVADDASGDLGTLQGWAVVLCTTVTCGNGVLDAGETCDDNNPTGGDGCSASCQTEAGYTCAGTPSVCTPNCGNGVLDAGEQCDQGGNNQANGDGCSSTCQLEANFKCAGVPSVCVPFETSCSDGMDNDGDGQIDDADDDCIVTLAFPSCAAGETRFVFRSTDTPIAIPDDDPLGMFSTIDVAGVGTVTRAAIVYNITHTFDSDLDIYVTPAGGALTDVCTGNGGSGDNFVKTVLDSTCSTNVTAGSAPFTGCFQPETPIGVAGNGTWEIDIADGFAGDTGTLQSWAVVLCATP